LTTAAHATRGCAFRSVARRIEPPAIHGGCRTHAGDSRSCRPRDGARGSFGFRRFKDTLLDYPELRRAWFQFHDARGERRAIEWLIEHELIEPAAAQEAIARRDEDLPPGLPGLVDAQGLARRLVEDLRRIYRQRLKGLVIIGPWARGGTHLDAPVSLVVVLDGVLDRWEEKPSVPQPRGQASGLKTSPVGTLG
jgi:hypothetical protein